MSSNGNKGRDQLTYGRSLTALVHIPVLDMALEQGMAAVVVLAQEQDMARVAVLVLVPVLDMALDE